MFIFMVPVIEIMIFHSLYYANKLVTQHLLMRKMKKLFLWWCQRIYHAVGQIVQGASDSERHKLDCTPSTDCGVSYLGLLES